MKRRIAVALTTFCLGMSAQSVEARQISVPVSEGRASTAINDIPAGPPAGDPRQFDPEISAFAADQGISKEAAAARLDWQRHVALFIGRAQQTYPDAFGGAWIDGGKLKVWVKDGATPSGTVIEKSRSVAALRQLAKDYSSADDLVFLAADHSSAELTTLQNHLDDRFHAINAGAVQTVDVEPDVKHNRVVLSTPITMTTSQSDAVRTAQSQNGDAIGSRVNLTSFERRACWGPWCDPPLRGGMGLIYQGQHGCTAGFVVVNAYATPYLSTAGHCVYEFDTGVTRFGTWQSAFSDGNHHNIGAQAGYVRDLAVLNIDNQSGWSPGPWIRTAGIEQYRISGKAVPAVGSRICLAGSHSWGSDNCGVVTYGLATRAGIPNTLRANSCGIAGDSGGPMYSYGVAYGIYLGGYGTDTCGGLLYAASYFYSALGVTVLQ